MKDRIRALRRALKLSQAAFARPLGMKSSALSMVESGANSLTDKNIRLICLVYKVNEEWLRTGRGGMFALSPAEEYAALYQQLRPEAQELLLRLTRDLLALQGEPLPPAPR